MMWWLGAQSYLWNCDRICDRHDESLSIGIAQSIAGVPMFSGLGYRVVIFAVFQTVSIPLCYVVCEEG